MAQHPQTLQLDHVILALEAAIDEGAWTESEGICGHCFAVGEVYSADPDLVLLLTNNPDPCDICKECLIHRAIWNTYLEVYP
ncbi:uncharacterized protein METZ01_LOCUS365018 [marine metagenome]|uniref:Uncharacterized protein n=1 Tax=marine metagenome TaxID=408172 RepID=A0A382SQF2_9ZZZZ